MTTPAKIDTITWGDIRSAADRDDMDAAVLSLQAAADIFDGGLAGVCLSPAIWAKASWTGRMLMLTNWLEAECLAAELNIELNAEAALYEEP
jgi:hypothetical protein